MLLEKGVKHCNLVRKTVRDEASKHLSIHAKVYHLLMWRNGSLLFSRDVALFRFISDVIDLISSKRSCYEKIYYLHINGTKVQNNYYKSIRAVLSVLHIIAMTRSFYPFEGLGVYPKGNISPGGSF